jgi:hypothetical protein
MLLKQLMQRGAMGVVPGAKCTAAADCAIMS